MKNRNYSPPMSFRVSEANRGISFLRFFDYVRLRRTSLRMTRGCIVTKNLYSSFLMSAIFSLTLTSPGWAQPESDQIEQLNQRIIQLENVVRQLKEELQEVKRAKGGETQPILLLTEPVERIQPVKEYICAKGHIQQIYPSGGRCPLCQEPVQERVTFQKVKLARREAVAEKIAAVLEEEFAKRVVVGVSATGSLQQVVTADSQDDSSFAVGSTDVILSASPAMQTTFFLDLEGIGGNGPDQVIASQSGLNADSGSIQDSDGVDRIQLREAWLKKVLWEDHLTLTIGKVDLTNYFDQNAVANDETTQFLTRSLVNNAALEQPSNAPGLVGIWDTLGQWRFLSGIQSADNSGSRVFEDIYGIGELAYMGKGLFGLESNYRIWARIKGQNDGDNVAIGTSLDEKISERFGIFVRYGVAEPDGGAVQWNWSLGLERQFPFSSRLLDHWAIGFSQQKQIEGVHEELLELYYSYFISHEWRLSPHAQYLFKTAGNSSIAAQEDVLVVGLRSQVDF